MRRADADQGWAHTRRGFERAKGIEPEAVAEAQARIGALYAFEQHIREHRRDGSGHARRDAFPPDSFSHASILAAQPTRLTGRR